MGARVKTHLEVNVESHEAATRKVSTGVSEAKKSLGKMWDCC